MRFMYIGSLIAVSTSISCVSRMAGSSELMGIHDQRDLFRFDSGVSPETHAPVGTARPTWNERVRSNDDVVTIIVRSAYLQEIPKSLLDLSKTQTGYDIVLFAEVQENSAAGFKSPALTNIIYTAKNVQVPGLLNFGDALAYGPTLYKGHPLRVKFTIMVLASNSANRVSTILDVVGQVVRAGGTPGGSGFTSEGIALIRSILAAQPDIAVFDYEHTFYSDEPEGHLPTITAGKKVALANPGGTKLAVAATVKPLLPQIGEGDLSNKVETFFNNLPTTTENEIVWNITESPKLLAEDLVSGTTPTDSNKRIEIAKAVKPLVEPPGLNDTFPWLSYGHFAILETQPYKKKTPIIHIENPSLRKTGPFIISGNSILETNYLTLSVLPAQIEEDTGILATASEMNTSLLADLRRSDQSVAQALTDISANAEKLATAILRDRAERAARTAKKNSKNCNDFASAFRSLLGPAVQDLAKTPVERTVLSKEGIKAVAVDVLTRYMNKKWDSDKECNESTKKDEVTKIGQEIDDKFKDQPANVPNPKNQ